MPLNEDDRRWIEAIIKPVVDLQAEHHRTLFGNGTEGNQGLRVDVDRIKEIEKGRVWVIRVLLGTVVAGAGKTIWEWVRSK